MNKKQQIKQLALKYFWEQKKKEIREHFAGHLQIYIGVSLFLGYFSQLCWDWDGAEFIAIIGLCIFGFWIAVGLIALTKVTVDWMKSNWKEAKERAKEELTKKKLKG